MQPSNEGDVDDIDAIAFVEEHGIEAYDEIFYHRRSDNVTACLQSPDARSRVIQICMSHTIMEQCTIGGKKSHFNFHDCQGRSCISTFSRELSMCLLEKSGVIPELNRELSEEWICALPTGGHPIFEWQPPAFIQAMGNRSHFDCLTALPPKTLLERRVTCEDGYPIVEHRLTFVSESFLRTNERKVRCVASQSCGLPGIFTGELACYAVAAEEEDDRDNGDDDALDFAIAESPETSLEIFDDSSHAVRAAFSAEGWMIVMALLMIFLSLFFQ